MRKLLAISTISILIITGCSANEQQNPGQEQRNTVSFASKVEQKVIAEKLEVPWSIEKTDNTMDYYNDKLYVAALRGSALIEFDLETGAQKEVITGLGRIRDVLIEDNYLYFISNNSDGRGNPKENEDKLYRISLAETK